MRLALAPLTLSACATTTQQPDACLSACLMQRGAMERVCLATCRAGASSPGATIGSPTFQRSRTP